MTTNNEELDNLAMCLIYYSNIPSYNAMDATYLYIVLRDYLLNETLSEERLKFLIEHQAQYHLIYNININNHIEIKYHDIETITKYYEKESQHVQIYI